ncbi:hypothetical protein [Candidatus Enterovibrio escicola]|uniref:hypothetical protein n=1 Tax=Candidatus Enterovibrio escicola TaxID=1927127 RepID=UPI001237C387|nr:hypothetical protein [Candidatus Enterovibrio escacola]
MNARAFSALVLIRFSADSAIQIKQYLVLPILGLALNALAHDIEDMTKAEVLKLPLLQQGELQ